MMCHRIDDQPSPPSIANGDTLGRRLAALTNAELQRLLTMVTLLAGADEALADIRIGLAAVEIAFYEIDTPVARRIVTTPAELLPILQQAVFDAECGCGVRLVID